MHTPHYYIGYFVGAPEVIPALNVMIFDNKHFFVGGYYGPSVRGDDRNIYFQDEQLGQTIRQYFDYLWSQAHLLNENHVINWTEIKHCGLALGYEIDELNRLISEVAQKVGFFDVQTLD